MSTTSAPFGLVPDTHMNGGEPRPRGFPGGIASTYGTTIGKGDPVILVTGGTFTRAANGGLIDGVFAGCTYKDSAGRYQESPQWIAGTTATDITAFVWIDKSIIYHMQANGSIAATGLGDAADIVLGTVNPQSGNSTTALSSSLVGAGNSAQMKIVGLWQSPGINAWGDAYTDVLVIINEPGLAFIPGNAV